MQHKLIETSILAAGLFCGLCLGSNAQPATPSMQTNAPTRQEVRAAIERGLAFLQKAQNSNGWWSTPDQPAVTALVLTAMNLEADPVLVTCYAVMTLEMLYWRMP
jgi:squalene-hopene/tetraprenyl-beta-curcumene cyclase